MDNFVLFYKRVKNKENQGKWGFNYKKEFILVPNVEGIVEKLENGFNYRHIAVEFESATESYNRESNTELKINSQEKDFISERVDFEDTDFIRFSYFSGMGIVSSILELRYHDEILSIEIFNDKKHDITVCLNGEHLQQTDSKVIFKGQINQPIVQVKIIPK